MTTTTTTEAVMVMARSLVLVFEDSNQVLMLRLAMVKMLQRRTDWKQTLGRKNWLRGCCSSVCCWWR
jgi:hypothetical protein